MTGLPLKMALISKLNLTKELYMSFIIGLFTKGVTIFLTKLLTSLASEKMVEWAFFQIAEAVTKSTATPQDDAWLQKIKEIYNNK